MNSAVDIGIDEIYRHIYKLLDELACTLHNAHIMQLGNNEVIIWNLVYYYAEKIILKYLKGNFYTTRSRLPFSQIAIGTDLV